MKANELRIDNLVYWEDKIFPICQINSAGFYHLRVYGNIISGLISEGEENKIKGIPLTEEWLLKSGFEKILCSAKDNSFKFTKGRQTSSFAVSLYIPEGLCSVGGAWLEIKVLYVHQLQNLYFSLMGEELTIKKDE